MDHVSRRFYLPVDDLDLFEGAMTGMIKALDDEHSIYVKVARKQEFEDDLNQEFVGIGIRPAIDPKTKQFLCSARCRRALPSPPASAPATASNGSRAKARRACRSRMRWSGFAASRAPPSR